MEKKEIQNSRYSFYQSKSKQIVAVKFITEESHSKKGVCDRCQSFSDKIFFLSPDGTHNGPELPLHPNCCCHYQYLTEQEIMQESEMKASNKPATNSRTDIAISIPYFNSTPQGNTVHMRVKDSPGVFGFSTFSLGDIEFDGFSDMMDKLEKKFSSKKIDTLIISNHGGLEGFYPIGNNDSLDKLTDNQILRLKNLLHSKSTVDIRMCYTSGGVEGEMAAQKLANKLKCRVIGYAGPVNYYGGRALYTKKDQDQSKSYFEYFFQNPKPKLFYPRLEKRK